ncbi:FCD domain-containing protein [Georgenia sp. TF02-10]|uniref:FadR/GntR family transcriptional regulator n=1 Tax=Georgenia sp. TF02-10 TaxID=2917725 RepID=UPI001FA6C6A1|nr:FCD domain-containing protein [Georgenia sp. TF02-10]UNX53235.1 FCD domain-containing protein [Georgenia sp. TF02-10]
MSTAWTSPAARSDAGTRLKHELERRIASQEWPVGYRLPGERSLATEFAVSRPVVREVLQRLAAQGLLEISPARGAFVTRPDGSALSSALEQMMSSHGATVRDVFQARVLLETEVAARAAERRGGQVLDRLAELAVAVDRGEDRLAQAIADLEFHSLLCVAADNPVLTAMHRAIASYVLLMMLRGERKAEAGGALHTQIVDAIRDGDAEEVRQLMAAHLDSTKVFFRSDFDRPVDDVAAENLARISGGFWTLEDVARRAFNELDALMTETERK